MDAILFSADPKLVNMSDAVEHLRTYEQLYFEVKFRILKEHLSLPVAGFIHVKTDKVRYVVKIDDVLPFSRDHYEKPTLAGSVKPKPWLIDWRKNANDIRGDKWKHALVITEIAPFDCDTQAIRKVDGENVNTPPRSYYRIIAPDEWAGFQPSLYKVAIESAAKYRAGGETDLHRALKKYVAENPDLIGLPAQTGPGQEEYALPSGDSIDVFFSCPFNRMAAEVKSRISPHADIVRGLFQCIKYRAVLNACIVAEKSHEKADAVLVLEGGLPEDLRGLRESLNVRVVENVHVPAKPAKI